MWNFYLGEAFLIVFAIVLLSFWTRMLHASEKATGIIQAMMMRLLSFFSSLSLYNEWKQFGKVPYVH